MLTRQELERLPGIGRAIIDADRAVAAAIGKPVITLEEARQGRALIAERDKLVRIADDTYGCVAKGAGGPGPRHA